MAGIQVEKHIVAPVDVVFRYATDFENSAKNVEAIINSEVVTEGPIGVGTVIRETRVMFKKEHTEEMEIVAFDPPHGYTMRASGCGCIYNTELRFEESNGGTDVRFEFNAVPQGLFAKVMVRLTGWMMKSMVKACAKDLDDLEKVILAAEGDDSGSEA